MLELTNKKEVNMFDELLINHSAPTLAGIKIANIFTYNYNSKKNYAREWFFIINFYIKKELISQF